MGSTDPTADPANLRLNAAAARSCSSSSRNSRTCGARPSFEVSLLLLMIFSIKPARPSSCRASAHWLTTFGAAVNPLTFHNHALVTSTHRAASRRRIRRFVARETGATCGCCTSGWSGRRRGGSRYFPGASNRDTARPQIRFRAYRVPRTDLRLSPAERLMGLVGSARQRGPLPELTDADDFAMYGLDLLEVFPPPRPDYVAIICDIDRLCPRDERRAPDGAAARGFEP